MMSGLAGVLWTLAVAFGPNGYLVENQLTEATTLPLEIPRAAASGWWVVFHQQDAWVPAFYVPPETDVAGFGLNAAISAAPIDRLLPALQVPRLFLYAPYYREDGRLRPLSDMAIDVAESYLHALFEASLANDRRALARLSVAPFVTHAAHRAAELMPEVPPSQRLEAYLVAVREFVSHLLSMANEIERADRRARERQRDLCALLDPPRTLFALWQQSIRKAHYPGRYDVATEAEPAEPRETLAAKEWRSTRRGLEPSDKSRVLAELLAGLWTGNAARDFRALCSR